MSEPFSNAAGPVRRMASYFVSLRTRVLMFLVTADRNLQFQQNLSRSRIGIILLIAPSNALEDLMPLVPSLLTAIPKSRSGELLRVEL